MILAKPTPDEGRRIAALRQYGVLDTLPEQALDDLTSLAAGNMRHTDGDDFPGRRASPVVQVESWHGR